MAGLRDRLRRGDEDASSSDAPAAVVEQKRPLPERLLTRLDAIRAALGSKAMRRRLATIERVLGVTRAGQIAVLGGVVIWFFARVVAGTAMYLFAYGAVLLVVVAYFIAPRNLKLEGERAGLFPRLQEGDRLDVKLALNAKRRMTTFILEERLPERLGKTVRVPITSLSSGAEVHHDYGLRATRRGVYEVGPLVAVASDPLGLAQRETVIAEPFEMLVHPSIELVSDRPLTRQFEDPPIRPPVSRPWPSGLEFYGMREYVPGDDLRRIVWRASARTGKIMVREAEQGITDKITVVLDTSRGSHSRDAEDLSLSFETGVRAAASLAIRHLQEGYQVSVLTNGGPLTASLRGPTSQLLMLDAFARVEMGREPLGDAIRQLLVNGQRDAHNIFITPKLTAEDAAQLKLLLRTGVSILVAALIWDEEDAGIIGVAASLGCQVVGIHPDQDLSTALHSEVAR